MSPWWERSGLEIRDGRLYLAGRDAEAIAQERGTPLFVYDLVRMEERARELTSAFGKLAVRFRPLLQLKAQRDPRVLSASPAVRMPSEALRRALKGTSLSLKQFEIHPEK